MLHFRIQYQHEIKAFLVQYDADWGVIAAKVTELFEIPARYVVLVHKDRDGIVTTIRNHEDLRAYLLGPRSARAVAGLPLDFDLKDVREWKYSIVSHIPASEVEDTDYERPVTDDINELLSPDHVGIGRFTDDDYTFINRPPNDPTDVHLVIPGSEESYPVPLHNMALGSTPNVHVVELKQQQEEDGTWDQVQTPTPPGEEKLPSVHSQHSQHSVDYPNIYLEEPVPAGKPMSVASSGPPRISAKDKGKGRAVPIILDPIPLGLYTAVDISSNTSVVNEAPTKPTIQIPEIPQVMSPIPLISNIVKKMSLEHARAHTIGEDAETPFPRSAGPTGGNQYETLVTQLVSLVDVVSQLLQDDGVAHQVRTAWDGFANRPSPGPFSAVSAGLSNKPKELALAEGLVTVMKRVQTIVEDDPLSEVEEQEEDVIWTHRSRGNADAKQSSGVQQQQIAVKSPTSPTSPKTPNSKAVVASSPLPVPAKTSKQRLEEAKAVYKAEKARYRTEREQRRRDKLTSKGLMYPDPPLGVIESNEPPIEVKPAPPGHRASLMSEPDRSRAAIAGPIPGQSSSLNRATSTVKAAPGSTYSPALLPAHISFPPAPPSVARLPSVASPTSKQMEAQREFESAADGGSEGFGTPKASAPPPLRPERASTQFDFDQFMELNAWKSNRGKSSIGGSARSSMLPPPPPLPNVLQSDNMVHDSPRPLRAESENTAPTPPPRPREMSPSYSPPIQVYHQQPVGLESALNEAFRANVTPKASLKRNRWGDGLSGLRRDAAREDSRREDSLAPETNPPPVYTAEGTSADPVLETGGPIRVEKGGLPVNEEFKRRVFAVLQQYNITQDQYPNLDALITNGIQVVSGHRSMVRLAAESNAHARETFLSEEVPNVVNRVLALVQRRSAPNYV